MNSTTRSHLVGYFYAIYVCKKYNVNISSFLDIYIYIYELFSDARTWITLRPLQSMLSPFLQIGTIIPSSAQQLIFWDAV